MKMIKFLAVYLIAISVIVSCEEADSDKEWGMAKIYMPQSNYQPYVVPNGGKDAQLNMNYSLDSANQKLNIYLGVYRSGLQELESYSVSVLSEGISLDGAVFLPEDKYTLPSLVTCLEGHRDVTFFLEVDLEFLTNNQTNNYSLSVSISEPTKYELNEELSTTEILIYTSELF